MNSVVSDVTWKMMDEITMITTHLSPLDLGGVTAHLLPLDYAWDNFGYHTFVTTRLWWGYCPFFTTRPCLVQF